MNKLDEYNQRQNHATKRKQAKHSRAKLPPEAYELKIHNEPCRNCQTKTNIEAHHLVPQSNFKPNNPTKHDPANIIPLCHTCHQNHHTTTKRIPRNKLHPEELVFIQTTKNINWANKWYPKPTS